MAEWRGGELGGTDDPASEVDVELEEVYPDEPFFSSPHGEETNVDRGADVHHGY